MTVQQEITLLRSAVISIVGRDKEGEYRPEFVKGTLKALVRPATGVLTTGKKFLDAVAKA